MTSRVGPLPTQGDPDAFAAAVAELEAAIAGASAPVDRVNPLLRALSGSRPPDLTRDHFRRLLTVCYRLNGMAGPAVEVRPEGEDPHGTKRTAWLSSELMMQCFFDAGWSNRKHIERSVDHALVLHPGRVSERTVHYRSQPNAPFEAGEAAELMAPYFARLTQLRQSELTAHLQPVWEAVTNPLPPFVGLFWAWLEDVGEGEAFRLALAFDGLAQRGQQRMGWTELETQVLGALTHRHPLVVTHAARLLGDLMVEPEERLLGEGAWSLPAVLEHLSALPRARRAAAGGFLNGFDGYSGGPLTELAAHPDIKASGFDIKDWVIEVLALGEEEPFLPGSQAFWFYLHEEYCRDPQMVLRLLDAGESWIAWMCITELQPPAEGMEAPLARFVDMPEYQAQAVELLRKMKTSPQG